MDSAEIGKDRLRLPVTAYDVFGYLIPGVVGLVAIFCFEFWISFQGQPTTVHIPLFSAMNAFTDKILVAKDWVLSATFLSALLIISYVIGHVIASVSAFFLDRVLISKGYGYPYQSLLHTPHPRRNWETAPFYRGLFFWINAYLLLRFLDVLGNYNFLFFTRFVGWFIVGVSLIKLVVGHFRGHPKQLERLKAMLGPRVMSVLHSVLSFVFEGLFAGLYNLFTRSLSRYTNTRQSFPLDFCNKWKMYFEKDFKLVSDEAESDNYWLASCYIADKNPALNAMLTNWLQLYSFARNLSTAFYVAFAYCYMSLYLQPDLTRLPASTVLYLLVGLYFVLSFVMLNRYYYLYYSYYSKFLYRAYYHLKTSKC